MVTLTCGRSCTSFPSRPHRNRPESMNSRKRKLKFLGIGLILFGLLWFLFTKPSAKVTSATPGIALISSEKTDEAITTSSGKETARPKISEMVESMLNTPVVFYGKVVDQNGDPVPGANVDYGLLDKFNESGRIGKTKADSKGNIEISGIRGAKISVSVYKDGYHFIESRSKGSFAYAYGTDAYTKQAPTKESPAVLVLHKMGVPEALVKLSSRQFKIQENGGSVSINLSDGGTADPDLVITSTVGEIRAGKYDWLYDLTVPEGGLVIRRGDFDFHAPEGGYTPSFRLSKRASDGDWINGGELNIFLKIRGGRFARVNVRFFPRTYRNLIVLEAFVNPTPGSRNLEFDPNSKL